jgi:uncharacterized protein YbjT (DUF2867 family)
MPVIVIGADHPLGEAIVSRLAAPDREVRAFISSPEVLGRLRALGIKVAVGDLSDEGHISAACSNAFGAVMIEPALHDGRELAFASSEQTAKGWSAAASEAHVKRIIWVGSHPPAFQTPQSALVQIENRSTESIVNEVAELDELAEIPKS